MRAASTRARSIFLADPAVAPQTLEAAMTMLRSDLLGRPVLQACAASTAMLVHFITTLILLIGELLTNNILRQAWAMKLVNQAGTEPNA